MREFLLTLSCPDRIGIVHAVSGYLTQRGCNILESQQFDDRHTGRFFMRVHFESTHDLALEPLQVGFAPVGTAFSMDWRLIEADVPGRLLIMVSKYGHCLNDLLYRHRIGALNADIRAIVSNHRDFESLAASYGVPFFHIPVTPKTKPQAEARLLDLVDEHEIEVVVLARYMQVLSDDLCRKLEGRAINIHHSFLPSFGGARPYQQAHERGVKLIGATAHYVTPELDEGPIIEQEVARVDHGHSPAELEAVGRDMECLALARAVRWHLEHRVILNGNKTVVFK